MTNYRLSEGTPALVHCPIEMDDVTIEHEYSLADMTPQDDSGTTDTDSETHGNYGEGSGYTKIYRKY